MSFETQDRQIREEQQRIARESILRIIFSPQARERLSNIKMVKPDLAKLVEDRFIQLASAGKLTHQVTDEELKQVLASLQQPKREFKIRWA
ncbi:MAG: DNA-binding protein [Nitrososphaerales archaeon]